MKRAAAGLIAIAFLCAGCGYNVKSATEEVQVEELTTSTTKASDLTFEGATEAYTVRVTQTEETEEETEEVTEEVTEDSTGEVDVNGYGWVELQYSAQYHIMDGHLTRSNGSIRCFGHRETWYSTNEGCGQTTAWEIPGKHVADDGTIRDVDGYICVASSDHKHGTIVMTSVGPGKVYDCGCSSGTIDVYTTW